MPGGAASGDGPPMVLARKRAHLYKVATNCGRCSGGCTADRKQVPARWPTVYRRFAQWSRDRVWAKLHRVILDQLDPWSVGLIAVCDRLGRRPRCKPGPLTGIRAVADTVTDLNDDLQAGGCLSGPAARRAIKAAARAPRFEGTVINATTARRLLANDDATLYNDPQALLLCHYQREQALCHRTGMRDTPRLDHCVPR